MILEDVLVHSLALFSSIELKSLYVDCKFLYRFGDFGNLGHFRCLS